MVPSISAVIIKLGDDGPYPILTAISSMVDPEEAEVLLLRLGAQYMSILGQAESRYTGLYGPMPVHSKDDYLSFLYAFELEDPTLQDERLHQKAYCILAIFFPRHSEFQWTFSRFAIEGFLKDLFSGVTSVQELENRTNFLADDLIVPLQSIRGNEALPAPEEEEIDVLDEDKIREISETIKTLGRKLEKSSTWAILHYHSLPNEFMRTIMAYLFAEVEKKEDQMITFIGRKLAISFVDFQSRDFLSARRKLPKKIGGIIIVLPFKSEIIKEIVQDLPSFLKGQKRAAIALCLTDGIPNDVYSEAVNAMSANISQEVLLRPFSFFHLRGQNSILEVLAWFLERVRMAAS
ncbi:MAG: hypothetical protein ACFFB3_03015 [Candidatus Hodarchaeota archaeon]